MVPLLDTSCSRKKTKAMSESSSAEELAQKLKMHSLPLLLLLLLLLLMETVLSRQPLELTETTLQWPLHLLLS